MRLKKSVWCLLLAPSLLACVSESGESEELEGDGADVADVAESAPDALTFCAAPPTPPPWDRHWTLSASNPSDAAVIDPDNGECDDYVISARNVETLTAAVTEPASDPDRCTGTSITTRRYEQKTDGSWSYVGFVTETGVWTISGCRLPSITWTTDTPRDARISVTTKRTYTSGQYSVRILGLKFRGSATVYVNEGPS
jgi:hypothetical protein